MKHPNSKSLREIASKLAGDAAEHKGNSASKTGGVARERDVRRERAEAADGVVAAAMSALKQAREAGGGGLRSKYLADAQKHMARIDPTRHAEPLQHLQAHVVAMGGRGGDTELAHVTPGEIVIPRRLQTPEFLKALYAAAHVFGIDPARLIVGSGKNVINPRTGQPEFDDDGSPEEITITAPPAEWSPEDYYYGERLPYTEAAKENDPALAQAIISTAINRVGLPGYGKQPNDTLSGTIQEPGQFQGINDNTNQPWRVSQDPDNMTAQDKATFGQYADVVHKRMAGELPDNSGGATFLYNGEPSAKTLTRMSKMPLVQTTQIGNFRFYKPAPASNPGP